MYSDITLIIPAKNESESLPKVLNELKKFNINKNVILERRDLLTLNSIKKYKCKIIFQKNKGYGGALIEGLKSVNTKYFCIFNADGSFDPNEIKIMLNKINVKNADFVFSTRYEKNCGSDDDTIITLIGNFCFTMIGKIFFRLRLTDILYTYVLGKTKKAKQLKLKYLDFRFCVELPIKANRKKFKLITSKSHERSRIGGQKKVNAFKDGLLILSGMIALFFGF